VATQDKIKELLGTGLSNEVVASSIGVHPSYISQLMSDEDFYNSVIELRTKNLAAHTVRDRNLDGIEDTLIKKMSEMLDSGMVYKPHDILKFFQVLNNAKRRGVTPAEATVVNNTVVNLSLPPIVQKQFSFKTNSANEVVEVEGQTMITMPAAHLLESLIENNTEDSDEQKKLKYEQVKKFLPQAAFEPSSPIVEKLLEEAKVGDPEDALRKRPNDTKTRLAKLHHEAKIPVTRSGTTVDIGKIYTERHTGNTATTR
jgi:hypothetical protein